MNERAPELSLQVVVWANDVTPRGEGVCAWHVWQEERCGVFHVAVCARPVCRCGTAGVSHAVVQR